MRKASAFGRVVDQLVVYMRCLEAQQDVQEPRVIESARQTHLCSKVAADDTYGTFQLSGPLLYI